MSKPLTDAINSSIFNSIFPKKAKVAIVSPLDKGGKDKTSLTNFIPISILSVFSKIFERVIKNQIVSFIDSKLSYFLAAYRKFYGTQHVMMRLIEEWKSKLDKHYVVGAVLLDLSKAFDCVPHDLLIAKLYAYGFDISALKLILSYLTGREQATRINNFYSIFQLLISGVPQGSILGPIIFNIFINDLFLFISTCNVHNYADDNTLSYFSNSIPNLIKVLEQETNNAVSWLSSNNMIVNPEKFHCIIISKDISDTSGIDINITNKTIKSEKYVKLLGISIDNKLNFNLQITELCKKASAQLNALYRLKNILPLKVKSILIQSFVYANFNYCTLIWNFSSAKSLQKVEKIQKRALKFILDNNEDSYETLLKKNRKKPNDCLQTKITLYRNI